MMIQVNINREKDGKYKLTWHSVDGDNIDGPSESLHETYEEASEKALQVIVAANPEQTRLTDYGGV